MLASVAPESDRRRLLFARTPEGSEKLSGGALKVLAAVLLRRMGDAPTVKCTDAEVAEQIGRHVGTVRRHWPELERAGFLERVGFVAGERVLRIKLDLAGRGDAPRLAAVPVPGSGPADASHEQAYARKSARPARAFVAGPPQKRAPGARFCSAHYVEADYSDGLQTSQTANPEPETVVSTTPGPDPEPEPEPEPPPSAEDLAKFREWARLPATNPLRRIARRALEKAGETSPGDGTPPPAAAPAPAPAPGPGNAMAGLSRPGSGAESRPRSPADVIRGLPDAPDATASRRAALVLAREAGDARPETLDAWSSALEYVRVGWLAPEWAVAAWRDATGPEVPLRARARRLSRYLAGARAESDRRAQRKPPAGQPPSSPAGGCSEVRALSDPRPH